MGFIKKDQRNQWIGLFSALALSLAGLTACTPTEEQCKQNGSLAGCSTHGGNGDDHDHDHDDEDGGSSGVNYKFPALANRVCTVDRFEQQATGNVIKKLDVLFVMDHSGSMQDDWERVASNLTEMVRELPTDTDIRYAVLLADVNSAWKGKIYAPIGHPVVLDNQKMKLRDIQKELNNTFVNGMGVGDATGEASFYSLYHATTTYALANQRSGFFRPDAALSVIFASDEQEAGFPFPNPQAPGLPKRCDTDYEENIKKVYYDRQGVNLDVAFDALKKLKGDMPVVTHAFINITKEDLFKRNSKNASCLYDSLGYGYPEMVAKTNGVLFSIQADRAAGMARCGQVTKEALQLAHDFKLSKPADKVDPSTILSAVDNALVPFTYQAAANSVHLDNAGRAGSLIEIRHCEPDGRKAWTLTGFAGSAGQYAASLTFQTAEYATSGKILYGTTSGNLNSETAFDAAATSHALTVNGLSANTVYYFQAYAKDEFGQEKRSAVISLRTQPDWNLSALSAQPSRNTATLSWKTVEYPTRGKVRWGLAANDLANQSAETAVANDHTINLSGLSANTVYFYQIQSSDEYGLSKTSNGSFQTVADWGITGFNGQATRTTVDLSWSTSEFSTTGKVIWGTSASSLNNQVVDAVNGRTHSLTVSGLAANTVYYFQAVSQDNLGAEKRSEVIAVRTLVDWTIGGFAGTSTTSTVTLNWDTGTYSTSGKVLWGQTSDALTGTVADMNSGTTHGVAVSGLNADTLYYFQSVSRDSSGIERASSVIAIRTQAVPVVTPTLPVWDITDFSGSSTETTANLVWNTAAYTTAGTVAWGTASGALNQSLPEAGSGKAHTLTVTGLHPDTIYYFQVTARDDQGQEKQSAEIAIHTLAQAAPTDPAPVSNWVIKGFDGTTTASTADIIWQTPGAQTKATLKVGLSATDLSLQAIAVDSFAEAQLVNVTGLQANTAYYFQVIAVDRNGRTVESAVMMKRTKAQ